MRLTSAQALGSLPTFVVAPLRSALQQQGFPPSIITDNGDLNSDELLMALVDTVEVRTAWTPPVKASVRGLVSGPSNPLWRQLKPTITLQGKHIGTQVIAPYGVAPERGSNDALAALAIGVGGIFVLGFVSGLIANR